MIRYSKKKRSPTSIWKALDDMVLTRSFSTPTPFLLYRNRAWQLRSGRVVSHATHVHTAVGRRVCCISARSREIITAALLRGITRPSGTRTPSRSYAKRRTRSRSTTNMIKIEQAFNLCSRILGTLYCRVVSETLQVCGENGVDWHPESMGDIDNAHTHTRYRRTGVYIPWTMPPTHPSS